MKSNRFNPIKIEFLSVLILTIFASFFMDLLFSLGFGLETMVTRIIKFTLLAIVFLISLFVKTKKTYLSKYAMILMAIVLASILSIPLDQSSWIKSIFNKATFTGNFGANITIKLVMAVFVSAALIILYKSPQNAFLMPGDPSVKVSKIGFLGIKENQLTWKKLAILSGLLIALGTVLLTLLTVIGSSFSLNTPFFVKVIPHIIIFAAANAFSEGIIYRSAIIAPLYQSVSKDKVILLSALFFGSFHYYGAPSGILGVVMSSLLGWFIARSVYETKGFLSGWVIHFIQDVVIFSTIALLGNYS